MDQRDKARDKGCLTDICNPSTWEAELGESVALGYPGLHKEVKVNWRSVRTLPASKERRLGLEKWPKGQHA